MTLSRPLIGAVIDYTFLLYFSECPLFEDPKFLELRSGTNSSFVVGKLWFALISNTGTGNTLILFFEKDVSVHSS